MINACLRHEENELIFSARNINATWLQFFLQVIEFLFVKTTEQAKIFERKNLPGSVKRMQPKKNHKSRTFFPVLEKKLENRMIFFGQNTLTVGALFFRNKKTPISNIRKSQKAICRGGTIKWYATNILMNERGNSGATVGAVHYFRNYDLSNGNQWASDRA